MAEDTENFKENNVIQDPNAYYTLILYLNLVEVYLSGKDLITLSTVNHKMFSAVSPLVSFVKYIVFLIILLLLNTKKINISKMIMI